MVRYWLTPAVSDKDVPLPVTTNLTNGMYMKGIPIKFPDLSVYVSLKSHTISRADAKRQNFIC